MKKLITIALLGIVLTAGMSCQKKNKSPQPQTNNTNTNPGPQPVAMSQQDSLLSGNWKLDKHEIYSNNSLVSTTLHNDSINCHLELQCTEMITGANPCWRKSVNGLNNCVNLNNQWKVTSGKLDLGGSQHSINVLTTSSLVIQLGAMSGQANIYYLHK